MELGLAMECECYTMIAMMANTGLSQAMTSGAGRLERSGKETPSEPQGGQERTGTERLNAQVRKRLMVTMMMVISE